MKRQMTECVERERERLVCVSPLSLPRFPLHLFPHQRHQQQQQQRCSSIDDLVCFNHDLKQSIVCLLLFPALGKCNGRHVCARTVLTGMKCDKCVLTQAASIESLSFVLTIISKSEFTRLPSRVCFQLYVAIAQHNHA